MGGVFETEDERVATDVDWGHWGLGDLADVARRTAELLGTAAGVRRIAVEPPHEELGLPIATVVVRDEEAVSALKAIAERSGPYRLAAMNDLAYLWAKQGGEHLDEAIRLAREVMRALPTTPAVLDTTGWIEHLRGRNDQALKLLTRAIESLSDVPEAHYHLGATYHALGEDR